MSKHERKELRNIVKFLIFNYVFIVALYQK